MPNLGDKFNRTWLSRFLNSPGGRVFRFAAGIFWLVIGFLFIDHWFGLLSIAWGVFPLSAGALDVCYISVALGGPFSGKKIRSTYKPTIAA